MTEGYTCNVGDDDATTIAGFVNIKSGTIVAILHCCKSTLMFVGYNRPGVRVALFGDCRMSHPLDLLLGAR